MSRSRGGLQREARQHDAAELTGGDRPSEGGRNARAALSATAAELGLPLVEDNPYGDLWFDKEPPAPLTARNPEGSIYLGSFSKILAPGLRMGFLVAPKAIYPKLLQAKQAAVRHDPD